VSKPISTESDAATSAMLEDNLLPFGFPAVERKKVTAAFDGGRITSANVAPWGRPRRDRGRGQSTARSASVAPSRRERPGIARGDPLASSRREAGEMGLACVSRRTQGADRLRPGCGLSPRPLWGRTVLRWPATARIRRWPMSSARCAAHGAVAGARWRPGWPRPNIRVAPRKVAADG
jgi:hypothetical protein